jgi:putative ABC transport system permease protein
VTAHLTLLEDEYVRRGMTRVEARLAARRAFGGVEEAKDQCRDERGLPFIESLLQDLRYAVRLMKRSPGFLTVAVLTLTLGIGANAVMFSVVNVLLLRPLPYRDANRLLSIETIETAHHTVNGTSPPDFYTYRAQTRTLDRLAAYYRRPLNLTGGAEAERVSTLIVSADFFAALGVQPALGRGFTVVDEHWGSHQVAILTDGLWRRRFGGDPAIVGQTIVVNASPRVVIGVLPAAFSFLGWDVQLFVPMAFAPTDDANSHNNYFLAMLGRLALGATPREAAHELNGLSDAIIAEHPENKGTALRVVDLQAWLVKDVRRAALLLFVAVALVLLIACANLVNLLLARATTRRREIALRLALGSSRARLLRQWVTEGVLVAVLGAIAGVGLARWAASAINLLNQQVLPRVEDLTIDPRVLSFAFLLAVTIGVGFGFVPVIAVRLDTLRESLTDAARTGERLGQRLRAALIVAEIALSVVVLSGAALMAHSLQRMLHADLGFAADHVLTMQVSLPFSQYVDADLDRQQSPRAYGRATRFFGNAIERIRGLPGVSAAGAINGLPLEGEIWGKYLVLLDRPLPPTIHDLAFTQYRVVAGEYFRAIGTRMLSGRTFTEADTLEAPTVCIVNQEMARRFWPDGVPLGKPISVNVPRQLVPQDMGVPPGYQPTRLTIVGVAEDAHYGSVTARPLPVVYVPFAQGSEGTTNMSFAVRTSVEPHSLADAIRRQVRALDPNIPVANVQTMEERVSTTIARPRLETVVLSVFAVLALTIAAIGIYGVMSYSVSARTRELGVRIALGADVIGVLRLVLRQAFAVTASGAFLGLILAWASAPVIRALLYDVSPVDPIVLSIVVLLTTLVALAAAVIPAYRATRVDPMVALHTE